MELNASKISGNIGGWSITEKRGKNMSNKLTKMAR